jgi:hypothetical protein
LDKGSLIIFCACFCTKSFQLRGGYNLRYLLGIPYVNRSDLLLNALHSIGPLLQHTIIIDNSNNRELRNISNLVSVYEPPVPLTYTESMNLFQKMASERGCSVVMYMHTDAQALPGTPEAFLQIINDLQNNGRKWGIAFTNYDALAAYNMEAIRVVGPWDTTFPHYFSDCDYYRRFRLAGYEEIQTGLPVLHHGSTTIKSDPNLHSIVNSTWNLYKSYYVRKWGGEPGHERYHTPYNR